MRHAIPSFPALIRLLLWVGILVLPALVQAQTLISSGSAWQYLDTGTDQGTAWRQTGFNDNSWKSGDAQLGYGDGDESTVVGWGSDPNNRYITTYFRSSFHVTDASAISTLTLRLIRDDGAVVYLNGAEVVRTNMPAGTITFSTKASASASPENAWNSFPISNTLQTGTNTIAVEVHQSSARSSDMSFDLELTAQSSGAATITRGPYLQMATSSSMIVRWRTSTATNSVVRYGPSPTSLTAQSINLTSVTDHAVPLTSLQPATRYYYSVGTSSSTLAGDANHFFITPPLKNVSQPTRIWVLGDSGTANINARAVRDAYFDFIGTDYTHLWLMLGDNAYSSGTDTEYQAALFDMYPTVLRQSSLWPTIGNHDAVSSDSRTQAGPYFNIFTLPKSGEAGGLASGTEAYYSFDYGNIHFICLDSHDTSRSPSGAMLTWLESDLAATNSDWIIAFWHHPPYSKGVHDSDLDTRQTEMRQNVLPILEAAGVDLVLSGHSHSYERSFLIDGHYGTSDMFNDSMKINGGSGREDETGAYVKPSSGNAGREGAVYTVAGSSGQTQAGDLNHPAMFISFSRLGSVILDVNGNQLDLKFLDSTGVFRDYMTLKKGMPSGTTPTPPSDLMATTISSSQIRLDWSDNSGDEDGFQIQRSINGTSFAQVVSTGENATTFTDSNLQAGTLYYYRVVAFNASGSGTSNIASATTSGGTSATLIPFGATWRYLDNGSDQGTAWRQLTFSDSSWRTGPAELGYGDGDEATVVSFGPDASNKYITTYFRHAFSIPDASTIGSLNLRIKRDDGAVVYLNGTEVFRTSMPTGTITYTTLAMGSSGTVETALSTDSLVNGTNVVAVEIHQFSRTSSDISFNLELTATQSAGGGGGGGIATLTRGPYLQNTRPRSVTFRWKTSSPTDSRVVYSQDPANQNQSVTDSTQKMDHSITINGLGTNTKYYYRVGSTSTLLSERFTFTTSPDDGHPLNTRIWAVGDAGAGTAAITAVRNAYMSFTGTRGTDVFLTLGDNAYTSGTEQEFQTKFFDIFQPILNTTALWTTLGERDTAGSSSPSSTVPYYSIFDVPMNGEAGGVASGTEDYYSFNYGNIHFISLDSMTSNRSSNGPMLTWLENDLVSNERPWIIAFWHHAPYSKGNFDSDTITEMEQMRQNANQILEDHGADLVLSAHSNTYERTKLINGHYGTSSTFNSSMVINGGDGTATGGGEYKKMVGDTNSGTVYVVTGSTGILGGGSLNHPAMSKSLNVHGSVVVDTSCIKMAVSFVRDNGTIADSFVIRKQNSTPTVTLTSPANGATFNAPASFTISASANDADSTVRKVRFFRNGTHIGTDFIAPYSISVSNLRAGTYDFTATVEDDLCAIGTTPSAVRVTVR